VGGNHGLGVLVGTLWTIFQGGGVLIIEGGGSP